jgi:16S rRNA (uracil1498-N3)-methyltransferase
MSLPTFVVDHPFTVGETVTLGEDAAHHMRVRRLDVGSRVGLLDGSGRRGEGLVLTLAKRHATVQVDAVTEVAAAPAVHLLLPVADKDRMLLLAEKVTELEVSSWRPVLFRRSRHVTPRGEGPTFHQKVAHRIEGALEQSRGAWAPTVFPEATLANAIAACPAGIRLLMDGEGSGLDQVLPTLRAPVVIAVGPEGGMEADEIAAFEAAGFRRVALGRTILRFETAAIAAVATVRAALGTGPGVAPEAGSI